MPVISGATAPTFEAPNVTMTGLASPSRGATETCVWRATIAPQTPGHEHSVSQEEIFVVLSGTGVLTLRGEEHPVSAGDALIIPAHTPFLLANPNDEPLELVAVLPVGAQAIPTDGTPFTPPWLQ